MCAFKFRFGLGCRRFASDDDALVRSIFISRGPDQCAVCGRLCVCGVAVGKKTSGCVKSPTQHTLCVMW